MSLRDGPSAVAPWRIATDVGGTFTDLVLADSKGAIFVAKALSVPEQPDLGVLNVLEVLGKKIDLGVEAILSRCDHFVHGSTIATKILVQGRGARVGLLVTDGFRDSLEIRRGFRPNPWDHRTPFPPVLVPRYLRVPVRGRIDRRGCEVEPLNEHDIRGAGKIFNDEGVDSVAICLFNSVLNNRHELAAHAILASVFSEPWITLSSAVTPVLGEYERSSTAVINGEVYT